MKCYRFYFATGSVQESRIVVEVLRTLGVKACTLLPATGLWEGVIEPSWVMEILTDNPKDVESIGDRLCGVFHQECVLMTDHEIGMATSLG